MTARSDDTRPLPRRDLDGAVAALDPATWQALAGARLLLTGGTGFIGRWMLEVLRHAQRHHAALDCEVVVLSRDPARFAVAAPHLAAWPSFAFVGGDVCEPLRLDGRFSHVVHAATDASADLNLNRPRRMFDTVVNGTAHVVDFAVSHQARLLLLSSGAVYGAQPWDVPLLDEDWTGAPDCTEPRNAYAEGKRAAEMLCAIARKEHALDTVTARIFAVLGPLLALDRHFAAGNFIREAMAKRPVRVESAGTAVRSYLYAADLAAWLWAALLKAPGGGVYNMGSPDGVTIAALAARTAALLGTAGHAVLGRPDPGWNPGRYVPSVTRIERALGVRQTVDLDEAIRRTARWNGWNDGQD